MANGIQKQIAETLKWRRDWKREVLEPDRRSH